MSERGIKELESGEKSDGEGGLTEKQWAVVKYTDAMTRDVRVGDDVFKELRGLFGEQEVVEITATVSLVTDLSDVG